MLCLLDLKCEASFAGSRGGIETESLTLKPKPRPETLNPKPETPTKPNEQSTQLPGTGLSTKDAACVLGVRGSGSLGQFLCVLWGGGGGV